MFHPIQQTDSNRRMTTVARPIAVVAAFGSSISEGSSSQAKWHKEKRLYPHRQLRTMATIAQTKGWPQRGARSLEHRSRSEHSSSFKAIAVHVLIGDAPDRAARRGKQEFLDGHPVNVDPEKIRTIVKTLDEVRVQKKDQ